MRLRLSILTACALASLGALAGPAPAVVDGRPDNGNAHGYVGVVLGNLRCSGTLVAPDLVVTATHCLFPSGQALFTLENPAPHPAAAPGAYVPGVAVMKPGFPTGFPFAEDVSVVKLAVPYPGATKFGKLSKLGVVDEMGAKGQKAHIVGYGFLGFSDGAPIGNAPPWFRHVKHVSLIDVPPPHHVMIEPAAACHGDSGGPLVRGSHLLAVASATEFPDCSGRTIYYRLDTAEAQAFLAAQGVPLHPAE